MTIGVFFVNNNNNFMLKMWIGKGYGNGGISKEKVKKT